MHECEQILLVLAKFYSPTFTYGAGSLKMNTALEYSTRVVQEGGRPAVDVKRVLLTI